MSAMGPKMAKIVGEYGDGIITAGKTPQYINEVLFPNIAEGAKKSGRTLDDFLKVVEIDVGYDEDYDRAVKALQEVGRDPDQRDVQRQTSPTRGR